MINFINKNCYFTSILNSEELNFINSCFVKSIDVVALQGIKVKANNLVDFKGFLITVFNASINLNFRRMIG